MSLELVQTRGEDPHENLSKAWLISEGITESMVKSLANIKLEVADLHQKIYDDFNLLAEGLGYAYAALKDAEYFLTNILDKGETFNEPPKKPELKAEDIQVKSDGIGNTFVTLPSSLEDARYMQTWFGDFFFPELRKVADHPEIDLQVHAHKDEDGINISFSKQEKDAEEMVDLPHTFYAGAHIYLEKLAKDIVVVASK